MNPTQLNYKFENLAESLRIKKHTWLVTGVAGFIGSHIAHRLLELNQVVVGIDNFSTGLQSNIDFINLHKNSKNQFYFYNLDITNEDAIEKIFTNFKSKNLNINYVIHQAALGSVPRSLKDPIASHSSNVDGFIKLLWQSHKAQIQKFIFASSSSVYGSEASLPKVEHKIGTPLSPYAATKRIDEIYAETFYQCYGLPTVGLRYFNVFGPRQNPQGPYAAVIPLWIEASINNRAVTINGDGSQSRDFCYIENVIQANLLAAMSDDSASGKVFNIAYEQQTTLLELIKMIQSNVLSFNSNLKIMAPQFGPPRQGDIKHSLADVSLAKKLLGYQPMVSVSEGLTKTIETFFKKL